MLQIPDFGVPWNGMMKNAAALRLIATFALIVPLAIYIGYLLSNPYSVKDMGVVMAVVLALLCPVLLRDHHVLPFLFWNSSLSFYFLPATPPFWLLASLLSAGFAFFSGALNRRNELFREPSIGAPAIFLFAVIFVTAELTGGIRGQGSGGDQFGGKAYILMFGAIIGFLALSSHEIPLSRAQLYVAIFFLSSLTAALSDLILFLGPAFYPLYYFISPDAAVYQAESEIIGSNMTRLAGVWVASQGVCSYLLARHGISGLLDLSKWWRAPLFLLFAGLSLLGGFRSTFVVLALLVAIQFVAEKLLRTLLFPAAIAALLVGAVCFLPFLDRMPLSIQRTMSFLPVHVDAEAKMDAEGTSEWRWEMWKAVTPDVPKYLLLGKGFSFNATDMYLTSRATERGFTANYETSIINNGYHNGPLTTIIPFGIWGALGFAWFCWASVRYLHRKKERGHPGLRVINTFLYSLFLCKLVFFMTVYGQFNLDLFQFTGVIGFAVALNRGAENRKLSPAPASAAESPESGGLTPYGQDRRQPSPA
jgi:hypothetical protein